MALATIVAVRGSTYRRPGARLLVPEDGAPVGNLSGGCLEGDVADMARVVMEEGRARLAGWDLTADDDAVWGLGLGCNGAIEVFIEPAEKAAEVAGALRAALEEERPISVVTVVESSRPDVEPGARLVVRPDGATEGSLGDAAVDAAAVEAAEELPPGGTLRGPHADRGRPSVRRGAGSAAPAPRVRCRTRRDPARPRRVGARMERDGRRRSPRVPHTRTVPRGGRLRRGRGPGDAAKAARVDERTFVVVMTHNFLRDKEYVRSMLGSPAAYVGMLGPGARTERLLMELRDEGVEIGDADRAADPRARRTRPRRRGPGGDRPGDRRGDRRGEAAAGGRIPAGSAGADPRATAAGHGGATRRWTAG